jgi:glycosyltransferase involved in cell wall biosynthesis
MRIGMMADMYKPHISGITNYIALNKRYLEVRGNDVYVFTFGDLDHPDEETNIIRSPGLPIVDTGYNLGIVYTREAKASLQTMDIVHVHHPFLSGRLALRYCRPLKIPVVFTNHTRYDLYAQAYLPILPEEISDTFLEAYMPPFCEAVDLVVSPSKGMAEVLRNLGVKTHIEVAPNGVDLQRFFTANHPCKKEECGFHEDDILLVYVGRLGPEKNLDFLIRAFSGAAQALSNIHLILVGSGPESEALEEQAAQSAYARRIHFTGLMEYEKLPSYLAMCDIFVTASVTEVHPLSVIEAMAAGLPVIGIESVGVGDTVVDGKTGFLSSNDTAAFASQITRLSMDAALRKQMGQAGRKESEKYDINLTIGLMLKLYERLVFDSAPRQRGVRMRIRSWMEKWKT